MVNYAIAGAGYIANYHARAIQALDDAKIVAVVEKYPERGVPFAECYSIPNHYIDMDELIDAGGVDALIIATPNFLHAPQAIAALKAGIYVMVEKPMAINASLAQDMMRVSYETSARLMVAHCWRFDEEVLWLKRQIDKGIIGKIIRTKGYGVHANWGPGGWFTQKKLSGGGALADMGIHAIDTARFLLGDILPVGVYARIGTHYGDYDVDDTGLIIINWDNHTNSYIEFGWWQPHMDGPEASTQVFGTQGYGNVFPTVVEIPDPLEEKIKILDPGFTYPRQEHCPQKMYLNQMKYFADCINNDLVPVPGGQEGLINMRIVDAAYESAKTGKVVSMKDYF